jgi:hypothetical protein
MYQTHIQFTQDKIKLLNKGLKYKLHQKHKNLIETFAPDAENAISKLDITEQNYYRQAVAKNIKKGKTENRNNKKEWKLIKNISHNEQTHHYKSREKH